MPGDDVKQNRARGTFSGEAIRPTDSLTAGSALTREGGDGTAGIEPKDNLSLLILVQASRPTELFAGAMRPAGLVESTPLRTR